jgi:hypothetical protein
MGSPISLDLRCSAYSFDKGIEKDQEELITNLVSFPIVMQNIV